MIRFLLAISLCLFEIDASLRSSKDDQEPVCSKYHFEEKVLEKLVRMEHANTLMMEEFRGIKEKAGEDLASLKLETEYIKNTLTEEKNKLHKHREELTKWITDEKEKLSKETEREIEKCTEALKLTPERRSYAFSAYWVADTSLSTGETLVFSKTIFDNEDSYDNSTGKYTVPVRGLYLFTAELCSSVNNEVRINFVSDGTRFGAFHVGDTTWHVCSQGTAIGNFGKGAKIWLKATGSGTLRNSETPLGFNYFAGYLISENRNSN